MEKGLADGLRNALHGVLLVYTGFSNCKHCFAHSKILWNPRGFQDGLFIERNRARYAPVLDVIRLELAKQELPDANSGQLAGQLRKFCFGIGFV